MRHRMTTPMLLMLTLLLPLAVAGCKGGRKAKVTPETPAAPAQPSAPAERAPTEVKPPPFEGRDMGDDDVDQRDLPDTEFDGSMSTVYFAFDSYELTPSSVATLRQNADALKAHGGAKVVVEGHADERGTIEYNLALGEKRARAVRDYLASLGISSDRVRIVTYGEERPAEAGHGEAAYSKNRRAEFLRDR